MFVLQHGHWTRWSLEAHPIPDILRFCDSVILDEICEISRNVRFCWKRRGLKNESKRTMRFSTPPSNWMSAGFLSSCSAFLWKWKPWVTRLTTWQGPTISCSKEYHQSHAPEAVLCELYVSMCSLKSDCYIWYYYFHYFHFFLFFLSVSRTSNSLYL